MESLGSFKNKDIHELLIDLIHAVFLSHSGPSTSEAQISFLLTHVLVISEAIAAFIVHEDTRISQKAITYFEKLVRNLGQINPDIIKEQEGQLQELFKHGLQQENSVL